jgi:hypothetical protein
MNEYEDQQRQRDAQYEAAWKTLSPAQRRQMAKHGITGPEKPTYRTGKPDQEAYVERVAASGESEPVGCDPEHGPLCEGNGSTWSALRRLVTLIRSQDNVQLSIDCFALVSGMQYDGESMAAIARRHGVTRAAVSKRCVELTETLGLKPAVGMRRLTTRQRYGRRARTCHRRGAH